MIPEGSRGVGGRLCPWSRCLTFAKPAKHPPPPPPEPCQGRGPGCRPGKRGQTSGTEDGGAGAARRGNVSSKKPNHRLHIFTHLFVCPSPLPSAPSSFSCVFSQYASMKPLYILSHTSPSTPHSICPFGLPVFLIIKPLLPPAPPLLVGKVNAVLYVEGFECNLRS